MGLLCHCRAAIVYHSPKAATTRLSSLLVEVTIRDTYYSNPFIHSYPSPSFSFPTTLTGTWSWPRATPSSTTWAVNTTCAARRRRRRHRWMCWSLRGPNFALASPLYATETMWVINSPIFITTMGVCHFSNSHTWRYRRWRVEIYTKINETEGRRTLVFFHACIKDKGKLGKGELHARKFEPINSSPQY